MIVASIIAIIAAGIVFLSFIPSYIALTIGSASASPAGAAPVDEQQKEADAAQEQHLKGLLHIVSPIVASTSSPTSVIASVVEERPKGVHIDQIIFSAGKHASLMLSGSADSDTAIVAYRTQLSADPRFSSVSVPVGALVGTDAGRFSITITGTF